MIWRQPHYVYRVPASAVSIDLDTVEHTVPGALVYAYWNQRRYRLRQMSPDERVAVSEYEILAPLHGAWLVESTLAHHQLPYTTIGKDVEGISFWSNVAEDRAALEQDGRNRVNDLISRGIIRPHVADILTPYQAMSVSWAVGRPWVFNVWPCGSGKTLGAIVASFTRTGPTLVLSPAKARHVWWSQVQEYSTITPFRVRPQGERKEDDETLDSYLRRMGSLAFVVVGGEAVGLYIDEIKRVAPTVLILDELHTHGSRKRWQAIHKEDGTVDFEKKRTSKNNVTRAAHVMEVANMDGINLRVGLTATPLDDGRPRRLWSQLDLLTPGGFSHSFSKFAFRHCDAAPGQYGGFDDRGSSNLDELRSRCSFFTHEVPYSESHAALPDTRVQVVYLDRSELNGAGRFSDEQTFKQAFKSLSKETKFNYVARERMIEARLAEACSRKRGFVIDEVKQGVRGGGKVAVFTARRNEAEVWAHKIKKSLTEGDEKLTDITVWTAHGGVSETERDRITDAYRDHSGPCVLVATGQSVGTGVDGLQTTDVAIFAMLPWKPGDFTQWKGRFDRLGGNPTLLKVIVATGTYDERVVGILVEKFGPIEQFLQADELEGLDTKLLGIADKDAMVNSIVSRLEMMA